MPSSSHTIPGTQNQFSIGHAAVRVRGQAGTRTNAGRAITPFMFNEEGYRVSNLSGSVPRELTTSSSMLVMRTGSSILRHPTSTVSPTPTTQIKTGLKTFTGRTLSTPSVVWLVVSWPITISTLISTPPSVAALSVTTRAKKRPTPPWSWLWNTPAR